MLCAGSSGRKLPPPARKGDFVVLKLFGKALFAHYHHHIMSAELAKLRGTALPDDVCFEPLAPASIEELRGMTTLRVDKLKAVMSKNQGLCEAFVLRERSSGKPVGTVWVMYRGGNDVEYRIRNIDAYIFDVYVSKECRGRGYAGVMICGLAGHLLAKGISAAHLAVSTANSSAIRAYEKIGFQKERDLSFFRILKVNLPYHKL